MGHVQWIVWTTSLQVVVLSPAIPNELLQSRNCTFLSPLYSAKEWTATAFLNNSVAIRANLREVPIYTGSVALGNRRIKV